MANIGIFGGTFDPIHLSHLSVAERSADCFNLDTVLFTPCSLSPAKTETYVSDYHRLQMLRLAIAGNPRFELSVMDIYRQPPIYTYDTLWLFKQQYPNDKLYFIMGEDNWHDFLTWGRTREIVQMADLIIAARDSHEINPYEHEVEMPGLYEKVHIPVMPVVMDGMSSSTIRAMLVNGESIRYIVPDVVLEYIRANRLYVE